MPEMTTARLPYTGGLGTPNGKGNGKTVLASYNTLNHTSKNWKVPTTAVDNARSN